MNKDVGLSASAFGFGAGLFYATYILFEIPSNMIMEKVGARLWIARIMISWGIVSALAAFVTGPYTFYASRLLLGAAEAGFFPGVILYLTYWFPAKHRGRIIAIFMVAVPASNFVGSPISTALLHTDGWMGLHGWQWLFIIEAIPAVILGIAVLAWLPNGPAHAHWLSRAQREWLEDTLTRESPLRGAPKARTPVLEILRNKYVLTAAFAYAGASGASQCLSLWQPQILKSFDLSITAAGMLNALPFGIATLVMIGWGIHSDRRQERVRHTVLPLALLAVALFLAPLTNSLVMVMVLLSVAVSGTYACKPPFWALATEWLSKGESAAGIAAVNAVGLIGGFLGTLSVGFFKDATGSYAWGLAPIAIVSAVGCVSILAVEKSRRTKATCAS
jgi:MFS family permease